LYAPIRSAGESMSETSTSTPLASFTQDSRKTTAQFDHRLWMQKALRGYENTRAGTEDTFADFQQARKHAAAIKWDAIEHLDSHLTQFADRLAARGTIVHWAPSGEDARVIILEILQKANAKKIIKSKCMTTEEIHLNDFLETKGFDVIESDLGEYIVQLRREAPYHFVFPSMHLRRGEISQIFQERLNAEPVDDPEALTMIARRALRRKYLEADVGISGANFGIADTGMISITENEGNARLTTSMPAIHIALMGIEKVLPRMSDLALFWPLLATAGTGQHVTCYNTLLGGPRAEGESDGPKEFHVILLDNHRTRLLADPEQRDALRCIRCGACLNVCPIFKNIGGHSYNTTYQGPIGSVITPHLRGLQSYRHLSYASSLCGACTSTCPVKIDLHHHLLRNRRNAMKEKPKLGEKLAFAGFAWTMKRPKVYAASFAMVRWLLRLMRPVAGSWIDPARAWTRTRTLPVPPPQTFKDWWRANRKDTP